MNTRKLTPILVTICAVVISINGKAQINNGTNTLSGNSSSTGTGNTGSGSYSFSAGTNNTTTGSNSVALGYNNTVSGAYSIAGTRDAEATGIYSIALGYQTKAQNHFSVALGFSAHSSGLYSYSFGKYIKSSGTNSFVLGGGISTSNIIENNINNSLMVGFNSNIPTLFVGPSSGVGTSGNIGVGTTTPQYKLDVNGTSHFNDAMSVGTNKAANGFMLSVGGKVRAEEIEVSLTSTWPDYVFKSNYELKKLSDVEQFIKKYKHLPNVPSEKEMQEGINLGDMDAILLRKIEELTLYIIELEKKIASIEK